MFCGNGGITILYCHMTLRDHMIEGMQDLKIESPSTKVATVLSLILICLVKLKIQRFYLPR